MEDKALSFSKRQSLKEECPEHPQTGPMRGGPGGVWGVQCSAAGGHCSSPPTPTDTTAVQYLQPSRPSVVPDGTVSLPLLIFCSDSVSVAPEKKGEGASHIC